MSRAWQYTSAVHTPKKRGSGANRWHITFIFFPCLPAPNWRTHRVSDLTWNHLLVGPGAIIESFSKYVLRTYSASSRFIRDPILKKKVSGKSFIERIRLQVGLELLQLWKGGPSLGVTAFTFTDGYHWDNQVTLVGPIKDSFAICCNPLGQNTLPEASLYHLPAIWSGAKFPSVSVPHWKEMIVVSN